MILDHRLVDLDLFILAVVPRRRDGRMHQNVAYMDRVGRNDPEEEDILDVKSGLLFKGGGQLRTKLKD